MHADADGDAEIVPAEQEVQAVTLPLEYVPAEQVAQVDTVEAYCPSPQYVHDAEPAMLTEPVGHWAQAMVESLENEPAAQLEQADWPPDGTWPLWHLVHDAALLPLTSPSAHPVQGTEPLEKVPCVQPAH